MRNVEISGILMRNSPMYHILIDDSKGFWIHDMEIYVDVWGQMTLDKLFGVGPQASIPVPTFPLNTDGIDPSASDVLIENVTITNYDDAVAVKPGHNDKKISKCAENMVIRNCTVNFGVGMTIGSVPPRDSYSCVRNITFDNITFHHPIKAIYVKTNPGNTTSMLPGSGGEITSIVYSNILIHFPIWWNIYIGPQ